MLKQQLWYFSLQDQILVLMYIKYMVDALEEYDRKGIKTGHLPLLGLRTPDPFPT